MIQSIRYAFHRNWVVLRAMAWLPFVLVFSGEAIKQLNDAIDPFTGFKVFSISVPNHCVGENPPIHVLRTSTGFNRGAWFSWFERAGQNAAPLGPFFSRELAYKPKDDILLSMRLYDYFGDNGCRLPAGRWDGFVNWSFSRPWHNEALVHGETKSSFEVWPTSSPRCKEVPLP